MIGTRKGHIRLLRTLATTRIETPTREIHRLSLKYLDRAEFENEELHARLDLLQEVMKMSSQMVANVQEECNL